MTTMRSVHPAYNPYFSACFFNQNSVFLSQQINQQCFSAGLSAQPNGAHIYASAGRPPVAATATLLACTDRHFFESQIILVQMRLIAHQIDVAAVLLRYIAACTCSVIQIWSGQQYSHSS
jgi:hypothetical protein